jgi:ABC-2 type transport system permease protein/oleandomycin transport system permease protein
MSVTTTTEASAVRRRSGLGYAFSDGMVMTRRNLLRYVRVPQLLVFSTIQPIMFVLLFVYVFGGAIQTGPISYVDFLMPGIFVQTAVFGAVATGIGLAEDMGKGMVDRFRSLPMARSAVLAGRTTSEIARNLFVVILMTVVGYLVGFRIHSGVSEAILAYVIVLAFGFCFSWISAFIGLVIRDPESVQAASFIWIFPLTFASSAFVPVASMSGWIQAWAKVNPVSITVDAVRGLLLGGTNVGIFTRTKVLESLAWIVGLLAVFVPLAISRYRKVA